MYRIIKSSNKVCGSDYDRVAYGSDDYEWLATKDVLDHDGFTTDYTMYRRRSDGMYVCVFGDRDLYRPEQEDFDFETKNESEAWEWFDSYEGFADDEDDIFSATAITANRDDRYFGETAAKKYGDLIVQKLISKTVSKRKDRAEQPGGLIYEANKLGIDMWDLLEALEGLCHQGRAIEIDDSTYEVIGGVPDDDDEDVY